MVDYDSADIKALIARLEAVLAEVERPGGALSEEERQWLRSAMATLGSGEIDPRDLRRAVEAVRALSDKQLEFLPVMLDGGMFGRRVAKVGFWSLVGLGTIAVNWDRVKDLFGAGKP